MQVEEFIDSILTEPDKFTYYYGMYIDKLVWRHKNLEFIITRTSYPNGQYRINYILNTKVFYGLFNKNLLVPKDVINQVSHHIDSLFDECRGHYTKSIDSRHEHRFYDALTKS